MPGVVIDEIFYEQGIALVHLKFTAGNELPITLRFPFPIPTADFYAAVYNNKEQMVAEFSKNISLRTPTGEVELRLSPEQTRALKETVGPLTWALDWSVNGTWSDERTLFQGEVTERRK